MSFVVSKRPVASCPINVKAYKADGAIVDISFVAQYHRHSPQGIADLRDSISNKARVATGQLPLEREDGTVIPSWAYTTDRAFIQSKLAGWRDVNNESGDAIPFTEDALLTTLDDWPELIAPLFNGFFEAHQEAREKN